MIVVVGNPSWSAGPPGSPTGRSCRIAMEAARHGAAVELVGRVGEDVEGEALMIALARAGVGHAAVLRDPARPTATESLPPAADDHLELLDDPPPTAVHRIAGPPLDAADVALGLSYIGEFQVLVVTDDLPAVVLPACVEGARFTGARLVVLLTPGTRISHELTADATVLVVPDQADGEGADPFSAFVGHHAVGLDGGLDPSAAFAAATSDWSIRQV